MPSKTAAPPGPEPDAPPATAVPPAAAPISSEAAAASPGPDTGGVFVNVSAIALVIPFPPAVVGPGRVVELPYTPTHRNLKPATPADIEASRLAEEAEAKAAADNAAASGQEQ